jgi:Flp pilus assembly protein TadG
MRRCARACGDEGSAALGMMVMFLVLFLAVGLVFDGGMVLATRRQVITAAEAAARQAADRADPFTGALPQATARSVAEAYVAEVDEGLRIVDVQVVGQRVEVVVEATAPEVFFPMAGRARTVVREAGTAEVRQ